MEPKNLRDDQETGRAVKAGQSYFAGSLVEGLGFDLSLF